VAIDASPNSLPDSPTPKGTTSLRKIISTVALKRNLLINFTTESFFIGNLLIEPLSPIGLGG
jgi:hypothetical protein